MVGVVGSNPIAPTNPIREFGLHNPKHAALRISRHCKETAMPAITLPDGSQRKFDHPVTVAEVAASIGPGLAKAALAGKVDGKVVDTSFTIDHDAPLSIIT